MVGLVRRSALALINVIMPVINLGQGSLVRHSKIGCRMSALGQKQTSGGV
jgi:hypothetical protein